MKTCVGNVNLSGLLRPIPSRTSPRTADLQARGWRRASATRMPRRRPSSWHTSGGRAQRRSSGSIG